MRATRRKRRNEAHAHPTQESLIQGGAQALRLWSGPQQGAPTGISAWHKEPTCCPRGGSSGWSRP